MSSEEEMIPIEEAVKRYGVTRDGIYYHQRRGNLQTFKKLGDKRAFVKVADLEALKVRPSTSRNKSEKALGELKAAATA